MHTRVTSFRYDPSRQSEVVAHVEQDLSPVLRKLPGFRRLTLNLDPETSRGVVISEWDDRQRAQALRDALGPALLQRSADAGVQLENSQVFEAVLQV